MTLAFVRDFFATLARQGPLAAAAEAVVRPGAVELSGLTPSAQLLTVAQLQRSTRRPVVLIVPDNRTAEEWRGTLTTFADLTGNDGDPPLVLPAFELDPYEGLSPHAEIMEQRALALWRASQALPFLVVPAASAATRLGSPNSYQKLSRKLRKGDFLDLDGLAAFLAGAGYQRQEPVEAPGQYSIRGGLVDVFSPEAERPVRIELFGDEIESLREFDPDTQRSVQPVEETLLIPLTSMGWDDQMQRELGETPPPGWEFRVPGLRGYRHSILDFGEQPLVFVSEPEAVRAELERWWQRLQERCSHAAPDAPRPESIFFSPGELAEHLARTTRIEMRELNLEASGPAVRIALPSRPAPRYAGAIQPMMAELRGWLALGQTIVVLGSNPGEVERLGDLFTEYSLPFQFGARPSRSWSDYLGERAYFSATGAAAILAQGELLRGFLLSDAGVVVIGSNDLFQAIEGREFAPSGNERRRRSGVSSFLSDFRDLTPGDFVVHVDHGIGKFVGLHTRDAADAGGTRGPAALAPASGDAEFMALEYAGGSRLYVPLTRLDLVQKYRSAEAGAPVLDTLGGGRWTQRKNRVRKAVKDMGDELLKLYAARQAVSVPACPPDGPLQREFEDAFPYQETEDQQRAINDVKGDLESTRPMDRLVVGDVGYGKTEVAMRAAAKMVGEGRQVAVLAPTTVLAFQHEQTFRQRFRAFPIQVDLLSRFRTRAQQKETLERLAAGKVDIIIGTHRLLSKDVQFSNLGLLVVDEEQRFGVRNKERVKQLRREVHVLAMSATPIPRTLNMSLAGLRDMSIIETAPRDRLAIQTVVAEWSDSLVASALEQELGRGGQVYFVHNRVESIWETAAAIQRLAPGARIAVGHGQMEETELEKVMLRFVQHEADILVSTTIIENGLDIPLANTIIIQRADRLGLSELYQLRGRVGRSNRRAYAYLLVPIEADLQPLARKRLAAMREFSDLGAGFKIAALDLELRGAGNLLGAEQSGNLDAVGFELYVKMLEQAVRELKGEAIASEAEVQLHMGLDIRIPPEYVPEENQRLRMYKRLAEAEDDARRADLMRELEDRYGPPPPPVRNLLAYAALRPRCRALGITGLERRRDQLWLKFSPQTIVEPQCIAALIERRRGAQFSPDGTLKLPFTVSGAAAVLGETDAVLSQLAG